MNKYKTGDRLKSIMEKYDYVVEAVLGNVVWLREASSKSILTYYYKYLDEHFTPLRKPGWHDLTPKEAKLHIGKAVWVADYDGEKEREAKLIWHQDGVAYPYLVMYRDIIPNRYAHCSLHNDKGVEAKIDY